MHAEQQLYEIEKHSKERTIILEYKYIFKRHHILKRTRQTFPKTKPQDNVYRICFLKTREHTQSSHPITPSKLKVQTNN